MGYEPTKAEIDIFVKLTSIVCDHKRLEVKGIHDNPNPDPNSLYISDPSLACLDCGMNVFNVPDDVSKIVKDRKSVV